MTRQISLIGTELDCSSRTIEASQISRLHRALSQPNAFLLSKKDDKPPTTLLPFILGNLMNLPQIYSVLNLNINNILLSRETIINHRAISIGDTITIRTFLKDAYEQQASSNPIGFVVLESVGLLHKSLAFYGERVIAVRGGFQRGRPK